MAPAAGPVIAIETPPAADPKPCATALVAGAAHVRCYCRRKRNDRHPRAMSMMLVLNILRECDSLLAHALDETAEALGREGWRSGTPIVDRIDSLAPVVRLRTPERRALTMARHWRWRLTAGKHPASAASWPHDSTQARTLLDTLVDAATAATAIGERLRMIAPVGLAAHPPPVEPMPVLIALVAAPATAPVR